MSDQEEPTPGEEQDPEGESSRIAGGCVLVTLGGGAVLAAWGIVTAVPETAYVLVGALGCLGWQRSHAWWEQRHQDAEDETEGDDEDEGMDVGAALRKLSGGDYNNVLLTELKKAIGAPDTKAVKALLAASSIRVRSGVRTPAGNGPGVHASDIPPPPLADEGAHGGGCCCRSGANANTNNAPADPSQEGLRVERNGEGGFIIYDPTETVHRRHTV